MATKTKKRGSKASSGLKVMFAKLSSSDEPKEIQVQRGGTLKDVLSAVGYSKSELEKLGDSVKVDGEEYQLNHKVKAGQFITVSPRVEGGGC